MYLNLVILTTEAAEYLSFGATSRNPQMTLCTKCSLVDQSPLRTTHVVGQCIKKARFVQRTTGYSGCDGPVDAEGRAAKFRRFMGAGSASA
jgi:hypothetical protein